MNTKQIKTLLALLIIVVAAGVKFFDSSDQATQKTNQQTNSNSKVPELESQTAVLNRIREASKDRSSRFWLSLDAKVIKKLKDDRKGSQHQRFLISPASDITLLVAHNIDLADYVPLSTGDKIKIRGRYEWNNRGGVVHWTHHDPKGRKEGGWIYHKGKYYK